MTIALWIMLIFLGLLISGFFEASELAIVSCDRVRMAELASRGEGRAQKVLSLLRRPELLFSATLMGSDISIIAACALAEWLVVRYLPGAWSTVLSTVVMTLAVLVLAQILPKSFALRRSGFVALNSAYPLRIISSLFAPLIWLSETISRRIIRWLWRSDKAIPYLSRKEIRMMISSSANSSRLHHQIRLMVDHIFDFSEVKLEEIMVRVDELVSLPLEATVGEAVELITERGFTRLPIFRRDKDNIIGVVIADDLLDVSGERRLLELIRIPQVVVKATSSQEVLQLLRRDLLRVAFVVEDEPERRGGGIHSGKVIGMVTLEDLIEEIVGDIWDEYDF